MTQQDRRAITGVGVCIGCHFEDTTMSACGEDDRLGMNGVQFARGEFHCHHARGFAVDHNEV